MQNVAPCRSTDSLRLRKMAPCAEWPVAPLLQVRSRISPFSRESGAYPQFRMGGASCEGCASSVVMITRTHRNTDTRLNCDAGCHRGELVGTVELRGQHHYVPCPPASDSAPGIAGRCGARRTVALSVYSSQRDRQTRTEGSYVTVLLTRIPAPHTRDVVQHTWRAGASVLRVGWPVGLGGEVLEASRIHRRRRTPNSSAGEFW